MWLRGRCYCDIMALHSDVTGSCNLVVIKLPDRQTIKFIVDCGLFQERECEDLNRTFPFNAENIDFCLLTHNHVDHTGRLPLLVKNGFRGKIYTTRATSKLLPLALADSYKVLKQSAKKKGMKPLYGETDVSETEALVTPCDYYTTIHIGSHVRITFLKNGHLVGAALILVQISYPGNEDINLLFTGDYNNKNMFFDVDPIPEWILNLPLTIIQESTYGYMDSNERKEVFKENLLNCMERGGTAIIPAFSLGRAQEALYEVKCMQESGELDKDIPIYFDGKLAIRYTHLYLTGELDIRKEMEDFLPTNVTIVDKVIRPGVLEDNSKKIVISSSGMGSYGPSNTYITEYISRPKSLIHFTGYTADGTLGRRLKDTKFGEKVEVGGLVTRKFATVEYTTEFSAHAKADEMIDFLNQFKNLNLVLVNHGQADVKTKFAERILDEVNTRKVGILGREYFFRVNHWGLQKTLSSKFG